MADSQILCWVLSTLLLSIPLALLHNQKAIPIPIPVSCRDKTKIDFI